MVNLGTLAPHATVTVGFTASYSESGADYGVCYGGRITPEVGGKAAGSFDFEGSC
jgi:hypothetical protein